MALCTVRRESGGNMIRILSRLKISVMAAETRNGSTRVLMLGDTSVARFTLGRCVPADEREARLPVTLDHIGDAPGFCGMATHAICSEIGFVDIGVAGFAFLLSPAKYQSAVAAFARRRTVRARQNESCRYVIEFRILPHRPGIGSVADIALDLDFPVRRFLSEGELETHHRDDGKHDHFHSRYSLGWQVTHFECNGV